ncbi:hypothetical protein ACCO45_010981 [Purpureocillium lilacinum]|uniref:Uncharacterized protein n=1 Tax=Purpureocillium lilacinum TaxID=33203 RepID=A0ACC4DJD0_PURLI
MQDSTNGGPRKYMEVVYSLRLDGSTAQGTSFACGLAICSQGQHQTQKFLTSVPRRTRAWCAVADPPLALAEGATQKAPARQADPCTGTPAPASHQASSSGPAPNIHQGGKRSTPPQLTAAQLCAVAPKKNISDSRLQPGVPLFSPFISPVNLESSAQRIAVCPPPQRYLGHQATLSNLLPHCTRVQPRVTPSNVAACSRQPTFERHSPTHLSILHHQPPKMSATNVEKAPEAAVNDVANTLSNTSISQPADDKAAANEAASASAAEGRRLYIGNLAYATTEGELKDFFKSYLVSARLRLPPPCSRGFLQPLANASGLPPPHIASGSPKPCC